MYSYSHLTNEGQGQLKARPPLSVSSCAFMRIHQRTGQHQQMAPRPPPLSVDLTLDETVEIVKVFMSAYPDPLPVEKGCVPKRVSQSAATLNQTLTTSAHPRSSVLI